MYSIFLSDNSDFIYDIQQTLNKSIILKQKKAATRAA